MILTHTHALVHTHPLSCDTYDTMDPPRRGEVQSSTKEAMIGWEKVLAKPTMTEEVSREIEDVLSDVNCLAEE